MAAFFTFLKVLRQDLLSSAFMAFGESHVVIALQGAVKFMLLF